MKLHVKIISIFIFFVGFCWFCNFAYEKLEERKSGKLKNELKEVQLGNNIYRYTFHIIDKEYIKPLLPAVCEQFSEEKEPNEIYEIFEIKYQEKKENKESNDGAISN